ncbi:TetR/AcrR family transcriptional regulator [Paracoccus sp. (in: a-proteobacteria)]|uniref:TetR/AcrR family transcriptional regulator n=1 Tax=Paracoccus sp. TaxID=267 RepID=UPI002372CCD0|nr:TetR/AcrR family transcriptional regulator [Paracoccus sp. (in: a-proteobacteria)]
MSKHQIIADGTSLHGRSIRAALDLLEESQSRRPTMAEIAKLVGVPAKDLHRIFPDDRSVLVAAAEQALVWLIDSSVKAVVQVDPDDSVAQFIALGETYIDWASANPSQFRLLQDERVLNAKATPQLSRYIDSMVDLMIRTLERARDAGRLKPDENIPLMALSSHAFVIGLGRMIVEGRLHDTLPDVPCFSAARIAKLALRDFVHRAARGSVPARGSGNQNIPA